MFHHSRCMVRLAERHGNSGMSGAQVESPSHTTHKSSRGGVGLSVPRMIAEMSVSARQERSHFPCDTSALPLRIDAGCCIQHVRKLGELQTEYLARLIVPRHAQPSCPCNTSFWLPT